MPNKLGSIEIEVHADTSGAEASLEHLREKMLELEKMRMAQEDKPGYRFKVGPEIVWAIVVATLTPLLIALSQFDPNLISDYRVWGVGLLAGAVRAAAAAVLAALGSGGFEK
jgi:hypothetical protein